MKIYLTSRLYRSTLIVVWLLLIIYIYGSIALYFYYFRGDGEDYLIFLINVPAVCILLVGWILCFRWETYAIIDDHLIYSYSWSDKKLHTVDTTKAVYYRIFAAGSPRGFPVQLFIALSNERFDFIDESFSSPKSMLPIKVGSFLFLCRYNQKTLIVMPYNDQIRPMLPLDRWKEAIWVQATEKT